MKIKRYSYSVILVLFVVLLLAGCSSPWYNQTTNQDNATNQEEKLSDNDDIETVDTKVKDPDVSEEAEATEDLKVEDALDATKDEATDVAEDEKEETPDLADEVEVSQEAKDLNTLGFDQYQVGAYEEALALFEQSIAKDDGYFYAHYNYACTLGVLMQKDYPMWYDRRGEVYDHLEKVLVLNPDYVEKFKTDRDLDLLRQDYEYYQLIGYSIDQPEDIGVFLENVHWYIQGPGVFTVLGGLDIQDNNRFRLHHLDFTKMDSENFINQPIEFEGSYTIEAGVIHFTLDEEMPKSIVIPENGDSSEMITEFKGIISEKQLQLDNLSYPLYSWYDEFSA